MNYIYKSRFGSDLTICFLVSQTSAFISIKILTPNFVFAFTVSFQTYKPLLQLLKKNIDWKFDSWSYFYIYTYKRVQILLSQCVFSINYDMRSQQDVTRQLIFPMPAWYSRSLLLTTDWVHIATDIHHFVFSLEKSELSSNGINVLGSIKRRKYLKKTPSIRISLKIFLKLFYMLLGWAYVSSQLEIGP